MSSEPVRNPAMDPLLTPRNAALVVIDYQPAQINSIKSMDTNNSSRTSWRGQDCQAYGLPIVVSTSTSTQAPASHHPPLLDAIGDVQAIDRTTINSWEDVEFRRAVEATGRRKLIIAALWTEACLLFPSLDVMRLGFDVFVPVDAVGGTSLLATRRRFAAWSRPERN